jgi:hypothetical protein
MPELESVKVNIKLPCIGTIEGTWKPNEDEKNAAWELYVELITRISVVELDSEEGLLREALSSLYSLFAITRNILKTYGTSVAKPKGGSSISFGYLSIAILNTVLRPVLAKWHPLLLDHESRKQQNVSTVAHEKEWENYKELRQVLNTTRLILMQYANLLAQVADVPNLIIDRQSN